MGKDAPQQSDKKGKPEQSHDKNIVDKILKSKNRFRSGLGFKQSRANMDVEKSRISQTVSRKKILQGTKADKTQKDDGSDREDFDGQKPRPQLDIGNRNYFSKEDVDENTTLSQQATKRKSKYWDPKQAFLEMIEKEKLEKA